MSIPCSPSQSGVKKSKLWLVSGARQLESYLVEGKSRELLKLVPSLLNETNLRSISFSSCRASFRRSAITTRAMKVEPVSSKVQLWCLDIRSCNFGWNFRRQICTRTCCVPFMDHHFFLDCFWFHDETGTESSRETCPAQDKSDWVNTNHITACRSTVFATNDIQCWCQKHVRCPTSGHGGAG